MNDVASKLLEVCRESRFVARAYGALCRRQAGGVPDGFAGFLDLLDEAESQAEAATQDKTMMAEECELRRALERLATAAANRENTAGDPLRLIECKAELREATAHARTVLSEFKREKEQKR